MSSVINFLLPQVFQIIKNSEVIKFAYDTSLIGLCKSIIKYIDWCIENDRKTQIITIKKSYAIELCYQKTEKLKMRLSH